MIMSDHNSTPSAGRPKNSPTYRKVKIEELLNHLSTAAEVPVAQKFLTTIGIPFQK